MTCFIVSLPVQDDVARKTEATRFDKHIEPRAFTPTFQIRDTFIPDKKSVSDKKVSFYRRQTKILVSTFICNDATRNFVRG
jgi:hypothetical protein